MITKFKLFEDFWGRHSDWIEYRYLNLEILENGDLKIILNEDGKKEADEEGLTFQNFSDYFDDIRANSNLLYFDSIGDTGLGMSDAPCILDGYFYDDNTLKEEDDFATEIYWYPNYMIKDFTEELYKNGYVVFTTNNPKTNDEIEHQRLKNDLKKYNL